MHSFEVHSNKSACRKVDVLVWNKSSSRHSNHSREETLLGNIVCCGA